MDYIFDSDEEQQFYQWLIEAQEYGLLTNIKYQPRTFELSPRVAVEYTKQLKTKTKTAEHFLFHPHNYTPDFEFELTGDILTPVFVVSKFMKSCYITVDVKGTFNKYGDPKQFSINQKWVYQKNDIYIEKVIPVKLFTKTWCPDACRFTPKKKQPVKKYIEVSTIEEFIEGVKDGRS